MLSYDGWATFARLDPWEVPAPQLTMLPGGICQFVIEPAPHWTIEHRNVRALHGMMTAMMGSQHGRPPVDGHGRIASFALLRWPAYCGWAVYARFSDELGKIANRTIRGRLFGRPVNVYFSGRVRRFLPKHAAGRFRVRVETVTPVSISTMARKLFHAAPTHSGLLNAMSNAAAGLVLPRVPLACEMVSDDTRPVMVPIGGKLGNVGGFEGSFVVDVNAPALQLLESAELGLGLGGRTAYGFGRISVADVMARS